MQAYAQKNGFEGDLALWDVTYWAERQKEELYAFTQVSTALGVQGEGADPHVGKPGGVPAPMIPLHGGKSDTPPAPLRAHNFQNASD